MGGKRNGRLQCGSAGGRKSEEWMKREIKGMLTGLGVTFRR